jgi:hypothetical protein
MPKDEQQFQALVRAFLAMLPDHLCDLLCHPLTVPGSIVVYPPQIRTTLMA